MHGILAGLAGATIAWLAILGSSLLSKTFALMLPLLAVVFYGLFNLGIVVHKVFNFRTYPSEQKSLLQDILRAKEALKGKGVFDDE